MAVHIYSNNVGESHRFVLLVEKFTLPRALMAGEITEMNPTT